MADATDAIDPASGGLALVSFVAKSSMSLHDTVQSFQFNPKQVCDLSEELEALNGTLAALHDVLRITPDIDLTMLELPLRRCGDACREFEQEILKYSSRSGRNQTSVRDWAKLRYRGGGIDDFRQLLLAYKSTINVFLAGANLHESFITKQAPESHKELINTPMDDLESHYQGIDERLQVLFKSTATRSVASTAEPHSEGKREHRDGMDLTATQLLGHMRELSDRWVAKTKQGAVSEDEVARLREEFETIPQCLDVCIEAGKGLEMTSGNKEVFQTSNDAVQLLVSANRETLDARYRGIRSRAIVGHLSDDTIRSLRELYSQPSHFRDDGIESDDGENGSVQSVRTPTFDQELQSGGTRLSTVPTSHPAATIRGSAPVSAIAEAKKSITAKPLNTEFCHDENLIGSHGLADVMTTEQPRPAAKDEDWDTKTTYSVETLSDNPKSQYLQAFASQLEQDIRCGFEGGCIENVGTKCLDFVLREFAWKLHEESSNPFQLEASVTIHQKRKNIIELLVPHLSDIREESTLSGDDDDERLSRVPFQPSKARLLKWIHGVEPGQPPEDDEFLHYEKFIRESNAYHCLLTRIRQYSQLTFETSDVMLEIGVRIRNELRTQTTLRKMSSREPPSSVTMTFDIDWNPSRFMREQGLTLPLEEALSKILCLTGSWNEAQAVSVLDYMDQTWPQSGRALIALLQNLVCAAEGETCSYWLQKPETSRHEATHWPVQPASKAQITATIHSPSVCSISVTGGSYLVSEIGEQIGWIASTLRSPPANLDVVACTPRIKDFHATVQNEGSPTRIIIASCSLIFDYEVPETSDSTPGFCWSRLFCSPTLVRGYPILQRSQPRTGLEIPLSSLANIIGAQQVVQWGDRLILKGFNMLMVATLAAADIIVWHLLISEDPDHRLSYTDSKLDALHIETSAETSLRMLETKRHVVGWCSEVKDMCGDAAAALDIQSSGLPIPPPSIIIDKLYLEAGTNVVAGLIVSINKKEKPFWLQRENDYPSMLKWISLQPVVFYDVAENRAWLTDGASALLHLTRISLFLDEHDRESPYEWVFDPAKLKDQWDGLSARQAALETLKNRDNLNMNVYVIDEHRGVNGLPEVEYSTLKKRVKKILSSLEILIERQASMASQDGLQFRQTVDYRRNIVGFDILDIVDSVGPVHPRIKHLKSWSCGWTDLIKSTSTTTIFGRGFGDLIRPLEPSTVCKKWKSVPDGENYVAVSVSTLRMLYERRFLRLQPDLSGGELTSKIVWMALDHPFAPCRCLQRRGRASKAMVINPKSKGSVEGGCYHSPVQYLVKKSRRRIGIRGAMPLNPTMLDEKGAVIFAQAAPPSWKSDDRSVSEHCDDDGGETSSSVEGIRRSPVTTPVACTDASGSSGSEGSTSVTVPSVATSSISGIQSQGDVENNVSGSGEKQSKRGGWRFKFWKKSQVLLKHI